jgi:hypothetical protein
MYPWWQSSVSRGCDGARRPAFERAEGGAEGDNEVMPGAIERKGWQGPAIVSNRVSRIPTVTSRVAAMPVLTVLRCTAKMLQLLDMKPAPPPSPAVAQDDWYLDQLWLDGRKAILLTHARTLFSVVVPGVRKAEIVPIGRFVAGQITEALRAEALPPSTFGDLSPDALCFTKTADRSVLGCMTDMAFICRQAIVEAGGLDRCDMAALNSQLRRTISNPRGYVPPIELVAALTAPPLGPEESAGALGLTEAYMEIAKLERSIAGLYDRIELPPALAEQLREDVRERSSPARTATPESVSS